ncbi:MAG: DUF349 domain-containing protein [Cytophagaceae bacterium]|nr:DUF349 domain-containing protein [Cytophagaceae bacterium]
MTTEQHESTEQAARDQKPVETTEPVVDNQSPNQPTEPAIPDAPAQPEPPTDTPEAQEPVDALTEEPEPAQPAQPAAEAETGNPLDDLPEAVVDPLAPVADEVSAPAEESPVVAPVADKPAADPAPVLSDDDTQPMDLPEAVIDPAAPVADEATAPAEQAETVAEVAELAADEAPAIAEEADESLDAEAPAVDEPTRKSIAGETPAAEAEPTETDAENEDSAVVAETPATGTAPTDQENFDQQVLETNELVQAEEARLQAHHADYSQHSKEQFINLLETSLATLKSKEPTAQDFKRLDAMLREIKPRFDQIKADDRREALDRHLAEEGADEADFAYKADAQTLKFDGLYGQLRGERNRYFQQLDKQKETNFSQKTELLARLRTLVDADEQNTTSEKSWAAFKQIQDQWKAAGNLASPHNNTLWQTFHALVDRYFNNRNIYFELKEFDRKRNMQHKIELCEKVEKLAEHTAEASVTGAMLDDATALFEEYKHIGPAPREANELLWQRFKAAMDTLYGKKREQLGASREQAEDVYKLKADIAALADTFTTFQSTGINEWNDKTKALLAVQDQWNNAKGSMPREKGRDLSQKFWADIKTFFRHKGEFFRQLEAKRDENLKAKLVLCEQVEALLEGEDSADATNQVIDAQRRWKSIGHVPERQKDKIFDRFKAACDAFFNRKRGKNADTERNYDENLQRKTNLCEAIEQEAKADSPTIQRLNEFKSNWAEIGYVPRNAMQPTQQRYIKAINQYVSAIGKLSSREREQLVLESEVALLREDGGGARNLYQRENDIRRKITTLENDIALTRNNLEFFARSKNSEKLRADFEKKIAVAERELAQLKHQIKIIREAEG